MGNDRRSIYQFRALAAIEEAFRASPGVADPALARLAEPLDLGRPTAVGVEEGTRRFGGEDPIDHFRQHWLSGAYFPGVEPDRIATALVDGFRAAVEAARKAGKPLVPIWVRGGEAGSTDFRVDHTETASTVVVAIITPEPQRDDR